MDDTKERLAQCFVLLFPDLNTSEILTANQRDIAEWDSIAAITLVNLIEEEFGLQIDFEALAELTSFNSILDYLRKARTDYSEATRAV